MQGGGGKKDLNCVEPKVKNVTIQATVLSWKIPVY